MNGTNTVIKYFKSTFIKDISHFISMGMIFIT